MPAEPLDLVHEHPVYYAVSKEPQRLELGTIPYLTVEGVGALGSASYRESARSLQTFVDHLCEVARPEGKAFEPAPLETFWSTGEPPERSSRAPGWSLATRLPGFVHRDLVQAAKESYEASDKAVESLEYETIGEGPVVQVGHEGSRSTIGEAYDRLHAFAEEHDLEVQGAAHEVHLDDPTPGEAGRTVVRLPVRAADSGPSRA